MNNVTFHQVDKILHQQISKHANGSIETSHQFVDEIPHEHVDKISHQQVVDEHVNTHL